MGATDWDAKLYSDKHSFVWKQAESLLELLAPRASERILDVGCGTGELTAKIAESGATVLGMDASSAMIEQARKQFPLLPFSQGDAREFSFDEPFDAVFSNATLHWVKEADQAAARIRKALKPGGRFVAEFGGKGNVARIEVAVFAVVRQWKSGVGLSDSIWYFPSVAEYSTVLERNGFEVTYATLFDRPTVLEGENGMRNWLEMFGKRVYESLSEERRETLFREVEKQLRDSLYIKGVWHADYRRLRIVARAM